MSRTVRVSQEGGEERRLGFDLEIERCLFFLLTKVQCRKRDVLLSELCTEEYPANVMKSITSRMAASLNQNIPTLSDWLNGVAATRDRNCNCP
jgi:hypothetical protein